MKIDEDEPNQSQNTKNQNTNTLNEQTLAIQYPTKSDYCNQQVPFLIHPSSNTKDILSISSYHKILK